MRNLATRWAIRLGLLSALFAVVFAVIYPSARQIAFRWFDTQGYPDLGELQLIEIGRGGISWFAFLTREDADHFETFELDLMPASYSKNHWAVYNSYQPIDVRDLDESILDETRHPLVCPLRSTRPRSSAPHFLSGPTTKLFVLARGLERHGRSDLAEAAFQQARKEADWVDRRETRHRLPGKFGACYFVDLLSQDMQTVKQNDGRVEGSKPFWWP
jgi:hypothetical protein